MSTLSNKQILSYSQCNKRYNVWIGAVRSGKTHISIRSVIEFIRSGPPGDIMIIGVNRATVQRNVLNALYGMLGFSPPGSKTVETKLYGRNIYFVGAHDEGAVRNIQGSSLVAAYVDEVTILPRPFFKMLESRLSMPGARLFATGNPEGPAHWFKKEFIDNVNNLPLIYWNFTLDDNPSLTEEFKNTLKASYKGMWYKRYILGEWAASSGVIYDSFDELNIFEQPMIAPNYYVAAIDYGTVNPTCCLLAAVTPTQWPQIRIEEEFYYDSVSQGKQKNDSEIADDIKRFLQYKPIRALYVDPSAASLKVELRGHDLPVVDAKNDVLDGIKVVSKLIGNKNIVVHKSCRNTIEQLQSYQWDTKAADRGEDQPVKHQDHAVDALRYLVYSAFPDGRFSHPGEELTIDQLKRHVYGDNRDIFGEAPSNYF